MALTSQARSNSTSSNPAPWLLPYRPSQPIGPLQPAPIQPKSIDGFEVRSFQGNVPALVTPLASSGGTQPQVIARIQDLYRQLSTAASLDPSPEINQLFTELVNLTSGADLRVSKATLNDPRIQAILPHLRQICAQGEGLLEHHWFERVHAADDPSQEIKDFPYYQNYEDLTRLETQSMQITGDLPKNVLFIGSGSLPLTSILLARDYGMKVDNLDIDPRAAEEGKLLAKDLGMDEDQLRFEHTDVTGLSPARLSQYDAFYVAALAGMDPKEKKVIFDQIAEHAKPGAMVLARSSHRLRSLLYPEVEPEDIRGFEPQVVVHPFTDVVNSVVIARKEDKASES